MLYTRPLTKYALRSVLPKIYLDAKFVPSKDQFHYFVHLQIFRSSATPAMYNNIVLSIWIQIHFYYYNLYYQIIIYILKAVVEVCDANNDGFIDFEEFKNLIKEAESAYVRTLFKTYNLNMDGYITQVKILFFQS